MFLRKLLEETDVQAELTYELNYLKEIKPDHTRLIVRLTRTEERKETEYLNAKLETDAKYSDEKTLNVGGSRTYILCRSDTPPCTDPYIKDLNNLHEMIMNLIASAESTIVLKNQFEVRAFSDLTSAIQKEFIWASKRSTGQYDGIFAHGQFLKDKTETIMISPELEQRIESIFSYAKEQRFLSFTRHLEDEQREIKQDGSDASKLKM